MLRTVSPYRRTEARKSGEKSRLFRSRTCTVTNTARATAVQSSTRGALLRKAGRGPVLTRAL